MTGREPGTDRDAAAERDRSGLDSAGALDPAMLPELVEREPEREREPLCAEHADDDVLLPRPRVLGPVHRAGPHVAAVAHAELVVHQVGNPRDPARLDGQRLDRLGPRLRRRRHGDRPGMVDVVEEPHADAALLRGEQRREDERPGLRLEADVVQSQLEALARGVDERGDLGRDAPRGLAAVGERRELDR